MDIDGKATWNSVGETPITSGGYNNTYATDRAVGIHRYDFRGEETNIAGFLDFRCSPPILPNTTGQRVSFIEDSTDFSNANGLKTEFGKTLKITTHTVSCRRKPEGEAHYKNYSGIANESDGSCDHPVYVGSFANPIGHAGANPFFSPHTAYLPDTWVVSGIDLPHPAGLAFTWVINLISIDASTVTFAAASLLHERYQGNAALETDNFTPILHEDPIDISFNVLWYQQKS